MMYPGLGPQGTQTAQAQGGMMQDAAQRRALEEQKRQREQQLYLQIAGMLMNTGSKAGGGIMGGGLAGAAMGGIG